MAVGSVPEFVDSVFAKAGALPNHSWARVNEATGEAEFDRATITQALLQLVDNAAKYSPVGSTITLGSHDRADDVEFWVRDEGPGIPSGFEKRIFERFGRVNEGRGVAGSGLGLSIVKSIAESHDGTVELTPTPSGAQFTIRIPRRLRSQEGADR